MRGRDPDHVIRAVGRRVAEVRSARGLTQAAFAEACGLTTKHVQKIELGQLNLTIRSLVRLANHLGVDPGALFEPPEDLRVHRGRPARPVADDAGITPTLASRGHYAQRSEVTIGLAEKAKEEEARPPKRRYRPSTKATKRQRAR